jgi:hypothetical protein
MSRISLPGIGLTRVAWVSIRFLLLSVAGATLAPSTAFSLTLDLGNLTFDMAVDKEKSPSDASTSYDGRYTVILFYNSEPDPGSVIVKIIEGQFKDSTYTYPITGKDGDKFSFGGADNEVKLTGSFDINTKSKTIDSPAFSTADGTNYNYVYNIKEVPAPLPVFGALSVLGYSRKLRKLSMQVKMARQDRLLRR